MEVELETGSVPATPVNEQGVRLSNKQRKLLKSKLAVVKKAVEAAGDSAPTEEARAEDDDEGPQLPTEQQEPPKVSEEGEGEQPDKEADPKGHVEGLEPVPPAEPEGQPEAGDVQGADSDKPATKKKRKRTKKGGDKTKEAAEPPAGEGVAKESPSDEPETVPTPVEGESVKEQEVPAAEEPEEQAKSPVPATNDAERTPDTDKPTAPPEVPVPETPPADPEPSAPPPKPASPPPALPPLPTADALFPDPPVSPRGGPSVWAEPGGPKSPMTPTSPAGPLNASPQNPRTPSWASMGGRAAPPPQANSPMQSTPSPRSPISRPPSNAPPAKLSIAERMALAAGKIAPSVVQSAPPVEKKPTESAWSRWLG